MPVLTVFAAFLVIAVSLQSLGSAYQCDFSGYDEAAHYVSGLLVHDYLTTFPPPPPMQFAQNFYDRYPKVAIGHWPPFFYLVQALWTIPFSESRSSVLLLMAVLTAGTAALLFVAWRVEFGSLAAAALGGIYLALPIVQVYTSSVMAEILLTLLMLCAALAYARYLSEGTVRSGLLFAFFAILAIMTKANGLALALLPPLAVLGARRFQRLKQPAFWLPAVVIAAVCGPWYLKTMNMAQEGWKGSSNVKFLLSQVVTYNARTLVEIAGPVLFLFAVIGFFQRVIKPWFTGARVSDRWSVMAALLISVWIFHTLIAPVRDPRHLLLAVPALLAFSAAGISSAAAMLPWPYAFRARAAVCWAGALIAFCLFTFELRTKVPYGAIPVAGLLLENPEKGPVLVSSEDAGEGAVVAEMAMGDERPGRPVLRASKVLAQSAWNGIGYRPRFETPQEVVEYLASNAVRFVVIDKHREPSLGPKLHHQQLVNVVKSYPERFRRLYLPDTAAPGNPFEVYELADIPTQQD
ncbi:MAG: ArnT family glycosyltransferase [Bryobacteraceae bacterium]